MVSLSLSRSAYHALFVYVFTVYIRAHTHTHHRLSVEEGINKKIPFCRWAVLRKIENCENHRRTIRGRGLRHDKDEIAVCVENIQYVLTRIAFIRWVCPCVRVHAIFWAPEDGSNFVSGLCLLIHPASWFFTTQNRTEHTSTIFLQYWACMCVCVCIIFRTAYSSIHCKALHIIKYSWE